MKTRNIVISFSLLIFAILISYAFAAPKGASDRVVHDEYLVDLESDQQDWNSCVDKINSEWGGQCLNYGMSEAKYTVRLKNTCNEKVDLMCCVQYENTRWQCFYRMDMGQTDTLNAYACKGSGKYLKWVRKAGDVTTKFPTREQVNNDY